jgi:hypothetical protein
MRSGELQYSFECITRSGRVVYQVGPPDFWELVSATQLASLSNPSRARLHVVRSKFDDASADDPVDVCGLFVDEHRIDVECGRQSDGTLAESKLSKHEENEIAIELAAAQLRNKKIPPHKLTKDSLRKLVKNSGRCGSHWSKYRFDKYVWKPARARAELALRARGGRRHET